MKVVYQGPFDEVEVPFDFGGSVKARKGETVDVPDTIGKGLLEQPENWVRAETKKGGDR